MADVALIIGLAGTGKTTLIGALISWMRRGARGSGGQPRPRGQKAPYTPAYYVRDVVTVDGSSARGGGSPPRRLRSF